MRTMAATLRSYRLQLPMLLVAVLFALAQTLALHHMAQHGFSKHTHRLFGLHDCPVYEYCDHLALKDGPAAVAVVLPVLLVVEAFGFVPFYRIFTAVVAASPRAPPLF